MILVAQGKTKAAIKELDVVCNANSPKMQPYMERGTLLLEVGKFKAAVTDFSKVLFLEPTFSAAYIGRGKAKFGLGNTEGACADWTRAAELNDPEAEILMRESCGD
jgi:Flp pilus assembly protein TadD